MEKEKHFYWGVSLLVIILVAGCTASGGKSGKVPELGQSAPAGASGDILAKVGERTISVSEFEVGFNVLSHQNRQGSTVQEQKEKYLKNMVEKSLFALEARAEGIGEEKRIDAFMRNMADTFLASEYYKREISDKITVSNSEVRVYYDSHHDEFRNPEKVRARHILIRVDPKADPEAWAAAEAKATGLKKEIDEGADFAALARKHSDDKVTGRRGGNLGNFSRQKMPQGLPDVVFSLKPGEITGPVKDSQGYYIIKVEEITPAGKLQQFLKVKMAIQSKLKKERSEAAFKQTVERLKEKYKIVLNTDLLASVKVEKAKKAGGG